jgi:DMSO/TMAO reductase YedYZ molybdopterin-dependent catalytic subunit
VCGRNDLKRVGCLQNGRTIISPDTKRRQRIPPGQEQTARFPVLHYGEVPRIDLDQWRFKIFGLVEQAVELDWGQFNSLPQAAVFSDIHCVTGWSRLDNTWEGVAAAPVSDLARPRPEARCVLVHAARGFTTNLTLEDFFQPDVLFALKHDGKPLTPEHGWPVRLVVPRLYFWKSAKWVTGVEFLEHDRPGFWETAGYHNHGDPWKEERYGG